MLGGGKSGSLNSTGTIGWASAGRSDKDLVRRDIRRWPLEISRARFDWMFVYFVLSLYDHMGVALATVWFMSPEKLVFEDTSLYMSRTP